MSGKASQKCTMLAAAYLLLGCATVATAAEPAAVQPTEPPATQAQEPAQAEEPQATQPSTAAELAPSKKKWEFATIGYVWFAGAWGETDVIGPVEPVELDLPFGKILKAFKFAFMGAAEARRDRLVFVGDLTFIHLDAKSGIGIRDPDFLKAELDSRTAEVTALGGYRVVNDSPVNVDLLAGGRMNFFKTTLQLEGPNRSASGSVKQSWFDPLLGARVQAPLGGKWSFSAYGDIGGFGIGSDLTWQAVATVNYRINRKMSLGAGWRHFKVNYDHGDFLYDVYQTGPLITFRTIL
jgi:hypothetical protein